ncbi:acyl-CoA thioester hydrolase [Kibdelosporangium banguiense]|uniref:Acyl-CoA thioester hydrolase n=1 Tax=Kibdelosporangium banguiense TaxID=1365924 RepID=A0ABS4U1L6_9PSEU|nr:acyl-CoA thioesterase [Kibdelosporangium banguiense]MBP2330537.1 acyl-CoA thioester hydrolase [Kibdelosporangium banguiense]
MTALVPVRRRVEHVDTDASGVVHFARYASLLETALLENLERLGVGLGVLARDRAELFMVEVRMRYRASARYPDELSVETAVGHVGAARVRIDGTVRRSADGVELAGGMLVLGLVDSADGTARALSPALHDVLTEARDHAVH